MKRNAAEASGLLVVLGDALKHPDRDRLAPSLLAEIDALEMRAGNISVREQENKSLDIILYFLKPFATYEELGKALKRSRERIRQRVLHGERLLGWRIAKYRKGVSGQSGGGSEWGYGYLEGDFEPAEGRRIRRCKATVTKSEWYAWMSMRRAKQYQSA